MADSKTNWEIAQYLGLANASSAAVRIEALRNRMFFTPVPRMTMVVEALRSGKLPLSKPTEADAGKEKIEALTHLEEIRVLKKQKRKKKEAAPEVEEDADLEIPVACAGAEVDQPSEFVVSMPQPVEETMPVFLPRFYTSAGRYPVT